jgi:hypothetical protein
MLEFANVTPVIDSPDRLAFVSVAADNCFAQIGVGEFGFCEYRMKLSTRKVDAIEMRTRHVSSLIMHSLQLGAIKRVLFFSVVHRRWLQVNVLDDKNARFLRVWPSLLMNGTC